MPKQVKNVNHNKFNLDNLSNKNGEHLTDLTLENRLICLNINFRKKKEKKRTLNQNQRKQRLMTDRLHCQE